MGTGNLHEDTLRRIKRGLAGYISYLAACEMNSAFSEYVLYEPILRILTARGYNVTCEWPLPADAPHQGDNNKRIDFEANHTTNGHMAIEVKWKKEIAQSVVNDYQKLKYYRETHAGSSAFLCVFGRKSHIEDLQLDVPEFNEFGDAVYADFAQTLYGCRIYTFH